MNLASPSQLDPELAQRTRTWTIALFILATVLILPACYVFYNAGIAMLIGVNLLGSGYRDVALTAMSSSSLGMMAWVALGVLLCQPSNPRRHLVTWPLVAAFGVCAVPSAFYWMTVGRVPYLRLEIMIVIVLWTVVIGGSLSVAVGLHHTRLALASLKESSVRGKTGASVFS